MKVAKILQVTTADKVYYTRFDQDNSVLFINTKQVSIDKINKENLPHEEYLFDEEDYWIFTFFVNTKKVEMKLSPFLHLSSEMVKLIHESEDSTFVLFLTEESSYSKYELTMYIDSNENLLEVSFLPNQLARYTCIQ